mgnify:CR=1 FL=1
MMREPGVAEVFMPKLFPVLREGYGFSALKADAVAAVTVAVVALPLSIAIAIAIAIASGVTPDRWRASRRIPPTL